MDVQEQYDYLFKIVIIGDTGVGKSNILSRFVSNKFRIDTATTIGVEFTTKTMSLMCGGKQVAVKLQLWDTAGQERYRSITAAYYRGAAGALLCYDITRPQTFEKCEDWMNELRQHAGDKVQVVLVGNKSDLRHLREVQFEEGQNLAQRAGVTFIETSAQSGGNIEEAFQQLVKQIIEHRDKQVDGESAPIFRPEETVSPAARPRKGCC